jgi:predicted nucleic acid-binding protein
VSGYICVDASVALKWVVAEELRENALNLYKDCQDSDVTILAPPHFLVEITNGLRKRVTKGELTQEDAREALSDFLLFRVSVYRELRIHSEALRLAIEFNRPSIYDTHYFAIARFLECEFWTDDVKLVNSLRGRLPFVRLLRDYA